MTLRNIIMLGILSLLTACTNNGQQDKSKEVLNPQSLNDKAMQLITTAKDSGTVFEGLFYLDQAISLDSTFIPAHINKMNTLLRIQKTEKALETLQRLNQIQPIPENTMFEGFIYERAQHDTAKASQKYREALAMYNIQFENSQDSSLLLNKGLAILFLNGQEAGKAYYDSLAPAFSEIALYQSLKKQADNFDRNIFLNNLW